jgi:hypothetical protein
VSITTTTQLACARAWGPCASAVTTEISKLGGVRAVEIDMVAGYRLAGASQ